MRTACGKVGIELPTAVAFPVDFVVGLCAVKFGPETTVGSVAPSLCERNAATADKITKHDAATTIGRNPEIR